VGKKVKNLNFVIALGAEQPAPCTAFACPEFAGCRDALKACEAFELYVEDGQARDPRTRVTYTPPHGKRLEFLGESILPAHRRFVRLSRDA
jgi:hypothetical protein